MRSLVVKIYKLRRLSLCIESVQQEKRSGDFVWLTLALQALSEAESAMWAERKN